ncbi:MAG TPA: CoA-binding protein [Desulfobacteraceae bacterium]|nr:CoA-binding protein [Desulfobacteraceae bacterium]
MIRLPSIREIQAVLRNYTVIAVVGLSPKPVRPSHQVAQYMLRAGYRIIPVNPGHAEILGRKCYPDLLSVPEDIDIVNIFRRADLVLPIIRDAITAKAKVIWMQEGIVNEQAAKLAEENGLTVIMDRCIMVDHQQYYHRPDEM